VRLTAPGATFDAFGIEKISAKGVSGTSTDIAWRNRFSSAGTVYLQDADTPEGAGDIVIRNDNNVNNTVPYTVIPALNHGGLDDDLTPTTLYVYDRAQVKLSTSFTLERLVTQENTVLDLNGQTLTLTSCNLAGRRFPGNGAHSAANIAAMGFDTVVDSSTDGSGALYFKELATLIIVK